MDDKDFFFLVFAIFAASFAPRWVCVFLATLYGAGYLIVLLAGLAGL